MLARATSLVRTPALLVATLSLAAGGCGGTSHKATTTTGGAAPSTGRTLAMSISESGTTAKFTVPASVQGGLMRFTLVNHGKSLHSAQLVRIAAGHTVAQALRVLGSMSGKTPPWVYAEGGLGPVGPAMTSSAVVDLPAGTYIVADLGGARSGPPAYNQFTVTRGVNGPIPTSPVRVTAAQMGHDRYAWRFNGTLTPGVNTVTFVSKGKRAIHLIGVARLTGNPTKAQMIKALSSSSAAPPPFVDPKTLYNTAALDGGKSQTTPLPLLSPGRYMVYCPLTDRNGGKRHFAEGMLTTITVQ